MKADRQTEETPLSQAGRQREGERGRKMERKTKREEETNIQIQTDKNTLSYRQRKWI